MTFTLAIVGRPNTSSKYKIMSNIDVKALVWRNSENKVFLTLIIYDERNNQGGAFRFFAKYMNEERFNYVIQKIRDDLGANDPNFSCNASKGEYTALNFPINAERAFPIIDWLNDSNIEVTYQDNTTSEDLGIDESTTIPSKNRSTIPADVYFKEILEGTIPKKGGTPSDRTYWAR